MSAKQYSTYEVPANPFKTSLASTATVRHLIDEDTPPALTLRERRALCGIRPVRGWQRTHLTLPVCQTCARVAAKDGGA